MDGTLHMLVIDDSADDRLLYRRALKGAFGDELSLAEEASGESGLAAIEKIQPGCVLLDYSLPGRNGIEVLKRIRLRHPHLPVIMLTGQGNEAVAVESMKEGAQDYITKASITAETLSRIVRMAIEHSELQRRIDEQHEALAATNWALSQEIAERREAEEEARRSQALLNATFDASPFAIVIRDTDLKILFWSRAAEKMFGYKAHEVLGKSDSIFDEPPGIRQLEVVGRRAFSGEIIQSLEQERRRRDGTVIRVRVTVAPIYIAEKLTGFVGIIEDVTERNAIERQLIHAQKMEAIGNLTGGMAHDFNNMLGVIIGNLDLLQPQLESTPETAELATDALNAALRGADLTQRLLAFARRQSLQPERIDVNELVRSVAKLLTRTLGEEIEVALELTPDLWSVTADPAQLESAIINLANNARDAMPKGGRLTITTSNRPLDEDYTTQYPDLVPGDYAMIEVADTGTGMPPEVTAHIFEPFFTTKEQGKGTGLGLSMVFGFVKQSAGHINVYSEVGIGTTFRLFLPRHIAQGVAIMPSVEDELPLGSGQTVLVVEDHPGLRRLVIRQLLGLGYRFLEADNANGALAVLQREPVDLLFSDVVMPGPLNGLELARAVQSRWPQTRVVLTSGFTAKIGANIDEGMRLLTKPYRKLDLARALYDALRA